MVMFIYVVALVGLIVTIQLLSTMAAVTILVSGALDGRTIAVAIILMLWALGPMGIRDACATYLLEHFWPTFRT